MNQKIMVCLVGMLKVGKEIHTAACNEGIPIVQVMSRYGSGVFLDLKLHDIPQTVYGAARAAAVQGVSMFNIHISGNEMMCKAALEGAIRGTEERGIERPKVIGVTVLTSLNQHDLDVQFGEDKVKYDDWVRGNTHLAKDWGLDGVVCPASKAGALEKEFGPWLYVTPGVKWKGKAGLGQQQVYTPDKAVQDCRSSILVIGSAITHAGNVYEDDGKTLKIRGTLDNRKQAAYEIIQAMASFV